MRHLILFFFACWLALCSPVMSQELSSCETPPQGRSSANQGPDISATYLDEARQYREQGR